jgi:hypothetical protein
MGSSAARDLASSATLTISGGSSSREAICCAHQGLSRTADAPFPAHLLTDCISGDDRLEIMASITSAADDEASHLVSPFFELSPPWPLCIAALAFERRRPLVGATGAGLRNQNEVTRCEGRAAGVLLLELEKPAAEGSATVCAGRSGAGESCIPERRRQT